MNQTPDTIQAKPDDCKIQTTPSSIVEPDKTSPSKSEKSSLKPEIKISLEEGQSDSKSETNLVTPSKSSPQPTPSKSPAKAGKTSPGKASSGKASPKQPEEPEEEARFDPKGKSITTNRTATGWL